MIEGDLPDETTGRAALKHAFDTVLDSIVSRTSYMELSKAIYMRKYIPSITGPVNYFTECENDNLMMVRMNRKPHPVELVIDCALEAFAQAHTNSIDDFRKYEAEWNDKLARQATGNLTYN